MSNTRRPRPPRPAPKPKARLMLLRVAVQPTFAYVTDDGVVEVDGATATVPAKSWTEFAIAAFSADELSTLQAQYEASLQPPAQTEGA